MMENCTDFHNTHHKNRMKKFLLLLLFLPMLQICMAQPSEYFVDHWYLHSFTFNNDVVHVADLEISQGPTLVIEADFTLHGTGFCNEYSGDYEYINHEPLGIDDNFIPRNISRETENCGNLEAMENHFFIPFSQEKTAEIQEVQLPGDQKQIVLKYGSEYGYQLFKNFPALGIQHAELAQVDIFPNPATDILHIQSAFSPVHTLTIQSIPGQIVMANHNINPAGVDISQLKAGMYFITLTTSEGSITKKFIKK